MKDILKKIVEKLFDSIPFSKKSEILKEEVNEKLSLKYDKEVTKNSEIKSLTKVVNKIDDVKKTCDSLNLEYDKDALDSNNQLNNKQFNKNFKTLKKYLIIKAILFSLIIDGILSIICINSIYNKTVSFIMIFVNIGLIILVNKKYKKKYDSKQFDKLKYDLSGKETIYKIYDKYSKKFINCLMIDIALISYFIISTIISVMMSKYVLSDIIAQLSFMATIIFILTFLTFKSYFYQKFISVYFTDKKKKEYKKYVLKIIKITTIYFLISAILIILLRNYFVMMSNSFLIFGTIYFIICLILNLTIRKNIVFKNININIKKIVATVLIIIIIVGYNIMNMDFFLMQPYINSVSNQLEIKDDIKYDEKTGVYTIETEKEQFKILQLTDIHLGGSIFSYGKDLKALKACMKLIETTKPDFVIVTGDLVFPIGIMSLSLNNSAPVMEFAAFMRNTGIPWAFTYGNHDTESMSKLNENDFDELMKSLSFKTSKNLLYPYIQPDIYGRSNQRIEIRSKDGNIIQEIFLIDSNDYIPNSKKINEYDYIHDDQVNWYKESLLEIEKEEGYMPKSMIFFHIPIKDYKKINTLYENGSKEVTYHYGILGEKMIDKICTSKYDTKLFDEAVNLGSTQAMFFGHDHYNNQSLEYKGIRLTYGYSIDYLVMPGIEEDTEQRGGTLIILDKDGSYEIKPYKLNDIK